MHAVVRALYVRVRSPDPHTTMTVQRNEDETAIARIARARCTAVALLLVTIACAGAPVGPELEPEPEPENAFRVLFIGNSLTYFNDLPGVLTALADSAGVARPLVTGSVALRWYWW